MAKKYLKDLKENVLSIMVTHAKWNFIKITEIRDFLKDKEDYLYDQRVINDLAENYGILPHITSAINTLRNEGHSIISSGIKGKGYTWAGDFRRRDLDDIWDDKFDANEKRRNIPKKEKELDNLLFNKLMENVDRAIFNEKCDEEVREKLLVIARKHKLKKEDEGEK